MIILWLWEKKFGPTPMIGKKSKNKAKKSGEYKIAPGLLESGDATVSNERSPLLAENRTAPNLLVNTPVRDGVEASYC